MLRRARVLVTFSTSLVFAWLLVACVGDAPVVGRDASTGNDGSVPPDASDASDAGATDAAPGFDGANGSCNGLIPTQAPQSATVECGGTLPPLSAGGGVIPVGHYYLADQSFGPPCSPQGTWPTINDAVDISAVDGGYHVDFAFDGVNARRGTLLWTMVDATHFKQSDVCPDDDAGAPSVAYDVSSGGSTTTLRYRLPFSIVTLKSY